MLRQKDVLTGRMRGNMNTDTIAAIATALSHSGIGIIRISGAEAVDVADRIYRDKKGFQAMRSMKSHTIHYGFIVDEKGETIDEVMVSYMKGPKSFTAEDTVEINCHAGILVLNRILELAIKNGARLAEPGEFTKRAFLNGRIDLSEAEAVMDVIRAENDMALKSSVSQLKGAVSSRIRKLREKIIYEIAFIESALDDPEHISLDGYREHLGEILEKLLRETDALLSGADDGRILKEGIRTVIVGKPNAGKSSFLNLLLGKDKAIVTDIAGTTRDILEEHILFKGIDLKLIDTAGIRSTENIVEKIGVEKTREYAQNADLILFMADSSVPLDENDEEIIKLTSSKKCIVLLNKTDLEPVVTEDMILKAFLSQDRKDLKIIRISAKESTGMEEFEKALQEMFFRGEISFENEVYITNLRHKEALQDARDSLLMVEKSLKEDLPEDFYSIDLMGAYASLGRIIGEEVSDDLIEEIFSKFCMGK